MSDSPPLAEYEIKVLGYMKECIEEGEAFLKHQKGFRLASETMRAIDGTEQAPVHPDLSNTRVNHIAKVATDLTALCTDTKPFWEYRTENNRFKKHCEMLGKLSEHWWLTRLIDLKNAATIQYALVAGSGYSNLFYNTETNDLDISAEDPRDVLPIRPPSTSWSIQECFGVLHRVQRTVNYVRRRFPEKSHMIIPDRDGALSTMSPNTRYSQMFDKFNASPFHQRLFGDAPQKELPKIPSVDLYTCYINDYSVNRTGHDVGIGDFKDGKPTNSWSYVVKPGRPLYPRKRCIVFTNTAILYDGPSVYWHGMFPYAKLTLDPWPWSWLGKGVLWDLLPIQRSLNKMMRVFDDYMDQVAQPGATADKTAVSAAEMRKLNTRRSGWKIRQNFTGGKGGIDIKRPEALPSTPLELLRYYEEKIYDLPGVRDLSSLMKLNQMPSPDTVEKLLENMSPSVKLRSRIIEAYMRDFATMTAWNFTQFYTLPQRLAILGPSGATEDDFDMDADTFLPAWLDEDYSSEGVVRAEAISRGPLPRLDRANQFFRQIAYHIAPSSLLNASEIETQLKYLQLARAGLVDHWTLLETLNVPNVGNPPEGAVTITERLLAEQQMGLGMIVSSAGRKSSGQESPQRRSSGAVSESG